MNDPMNTTPGQYSIEILHTVKISGDPGFELSETINTESSRILFKRKVQAGEALYAVDCRINGRLMHGGVFVKDGQNMEEAIMLCLAAMRNMLKADIKFLPGTRREN